MLVAGIAAQEGHEECVRLLLAVGADPNHSDHCGRNALKVAAKSGHQGVVKLLEQAQTSGTALVSKGGYGFSGNHSEPFCGVSRVCSGATQVIETWKSTTHQEMG